MTTVNRYTQLTFIYNLCNAKRNQRITPLYIANLIPSAIRNDMYRYSQQQFPLTVNTNFNSILSVWSMQIWLENKFISRENS